MYLDNDIFSVIYVLERLARSCLRKTRRMRGWQRKLRRRRKPNGSKKVGDELPKRLLTTFRPKRSERCSLRKRRRQRLVLQLKQRKIPYLLSNKVGFAFFLHRTAETELPCPALILCKMLHIVHVSMFFWRFSSVRASWAWENFFQNFYKLPVHFFLFIFPYVLTRMIFEFFTLFRFCFWQRFTSCECRWNDKVSCSVRVCCSKRG